MNPELKIQAAEPFEAGVSSALLRLDNVSKQYGGNGELVRALNEVSLDLRAGEFVSIVGRSGCGKSTLLNLAGAMDVPTSGTVWLDGVATSALDDTGLTLLRRSKVGFIFQAFQLLNSLTVIENVELPLLLAGRNDARTRAHELLEEVELAELGERMAHQLSGGQMQRVAIARALVHSPRLLLADEPTGNLDTTTGNHIVELLRHICDRQHTAILMATHSAEANRFSDAILHMRDGRIEDVVRI